MIGAPALGGETCAARGQQKATQIPHRLGKCKQAVFLDFISPAIIFKHYRELTTEDKAMDWFGILPQP
jgi:hypothetical protein